MLIYAPSPVVFNTTSTSSYILAGAVKSSSNINKSTGYLTRGGGRFSMTITSLFAAGAVLASAATGASIEAPQQQQQQQAETETLSNIPQTLSGGECASVSPKDCKKARIQRPKSRKAESCTIKCVTTCIRGGEGSPGEGPFNVRRFVLLSFRLL